MGIMDHLHKFFAEIGKVHAGTAVNIGAAMPIFFKAFKVRSTSSFDTLQFHAQKGVPRYSLVGF